MSGGREFDVAVVGAGIGGCTAARLFALAGARVALIEKRPDPDAYKVTCTHAILPTATDTLERLGLAPKLVESGAVRTQAEFWTPYSGWLSLPDEIPDGWGVTRQTLDPLLRELAASTPGVELLAGWAPVRVLEVGGRTAGVELEDRAHTRREVRARLVVGADGRDSALARLANVPGRVRPHNRFFYFAYWRGVEPSGRTIRLWFLDPEGAAQFPNEGGLELLAAVYHRDRLPEVRADPEAAYMERLTSVPDGPDLSHAERVSKLLGKIEMPNVIRPAARPGLAFVGDAALATDPLFGVGIGFAFQSAEWLVDETSEALGRGDEALDRALRRYARRFLWRLGLHHLAIADFSTGRTMRPVERLTFRRAVHDHTLMHAIGEVMTRDRSPLHLADPRMVSRMLFPRRTLGAACRLASASSSAWR